MMEKLNLLPWREQQRQQHRQRFYVLIAATVLLTGSGGWGGLGYLAQQQTIQQVRNQQLEQAIASLEQQLALLPKLDRQRLAYQERLVVIGKIQQARNQVTHLLNLLPAMVPEGVYLDQVSLTARRVALQGEGDSNGQLAMLLARAEQSPWISDVAMHSIVARDGERDAPDNIRFSASFQLRSPQTERAGTQPKGGRHE